MVTEADLRARLKLLTDQEGVRAVARRYDVSPQFLSRVVNGQASVSTRIAERLGYRRRTVFEPVASGQRENG